VCPDPQRLEDIISIRDAMRQISQEASVAVDLLDAKVEDGLLDGRTEAGDVRATGFGFDPLARTDQS
jgi:hypothetical protein